MQADQEPDASDVVEVGDLAYWPPGMAFCIFFGRTPASQGNEVRAASPCECGGAIWTILPVDALAPGSHRHGDSDRGGLSEASYRWSQAALRYGLTVRLLSGIFLIAARGFQVPDSRHGPRLGDRQPQKRVRTACRWAIH